MKIKHKLLLSFISITLLIILVEYVASISIRKVLYKNIANSSVALAAGALDSIDRSIYGKIEAFDRFAHSSELHKILTESNLELEQIENPQAYITKQDSLWTLPQVQPMTPFIQDILTNNLSQTLRDEQDFYNNKYKYKMIGEIFITNKYGTNVAMTEKTTDYYQADEQWWQLAKDKDLYVGDVGYDESSQVYSMTICIKINDSKDNFIGVLKVGLNITDVLSAIDEIVSRGETDFKLLSRDNTVIYSNDEYKFGEAFPSALLEFLNNSHERGYSDNNYFIGIDDPNEKRRELFVYAGSKGYRDYKGLGWHLVIEQDETIFAPVIKLRNNVLKLSFIVATLAILIGSFISRSISDSLVKLKNTAIQIGKGNFDIPVEVTSHDEVGSLAIVLRKMVHDLKKTTTSVTQLNKEIDHRKNAEQNLLYNIKTQKIFNRLLSLSLDDLQLNEILDMSLTTILDIPWLYTEKKGCIFTVDEHEKFLVMQVSHGLGDSQKELCRKVPFGKCICGIAAAEARIQFVAQIDHQHHIRPKNMTPHGHYAVPLISTDKILGVLTLYLKDGATKNIEREQFLQSIASILAGIITRKNFEKNIANVNNNLEKTVEKLTSANRELADFAHITAHDLKAPLRAVGSLAGIIVSQYRDKLDDKGRELLETLLGRTKRINNQISGILRYSEIGKIQYSRKLTNFNIAVAEVIKSLDIPANINITVENKLPTAVFERTYVTQIFNYLLDNAIKYMDKPHGRIRINCVEKEDCWKFSVSDNGPGIDQKYHDTIFQIFQTLSRKDEHETNGIGLSMVKKIVETCGGRTWLTSQVGLGTTFFFTLPKQSADVNKEQFENHSAI
ncbi:MAG: ATP-binding protein [Phycisphaerae bacterium]|nr:ATP-binding protein [Phycisphaerae bacterium]